MEQSIDVLKRVFTYGNATDTHLDILAFLIEAGISENEYKKWGRNKVATQPAEVYTRQAGYPHVHRRNE
jgi:hypothetical protein